MAFDDFNEIYEDIVQTYSDMVTSICLVRLRNYEDAKDCYQNVFFKLFKHQPNFENEEHLKAWLIKVTIRECIDCSRQFWKRKVVCTEEIIAAVPKEEQAVMQELLQLPAKYRDTLYLYYYEGYQIKEIAAILKRKEGTIKAQLSRGKKLLKPLLEVEYHER